MRRLPLPTFLSGRLEFGLHGSKLFAQIEDKIAYLDKKQALWLKTKIEQGVEALDKDPEYMLYCILTDEKYNSVDVIKKDIQEWVDKYAEGWNNIS